MFESDNDKLFLNKIPFSNMDALCDPSIADMTGRVLEAFGLTKHSKNKIYIASDLVEQIACAYRSAVEYLVSVPEQTGAWWGR